MSYVKDPIYGNHLGIVVNDASFDPEQRGRVQVWIPYLTNTLHSGWNDKIEDKSFKHVHESGALTPELLEELKNVLPWAECAGPIMGGGTSATYNPATGITDTNPNRTLGPIAPAKPLTDPTLNGLIQEATRLNQNTNRRLNFDENSWGGRCLTASTTLAAAGLGYEPLAKEFTAIHGGSTAASVARGENRSFQNSGFYKDPTTITSDYIPTLGDQIAMEGGSKGAGHIITCIDDGRISGEVKFASDNYGKENYKDYLIGGRKNVIGGGRYSNVKVLSLNPEGKKRWESRMAISDSEISKRAADTAEVAGSTINPSSKAKAADFTVNNINSNSNITSDFKNHPARSGEKNVVDQQLLYSNIYDQLKRKMGDTPVPQDITQYGVQPNLEGLATLMMKVANKESSFNSNTLGDVSGLKTYKSTNGNIIPSGSHGLFQLSPADASIGWARGFKGNGEVIEGTNANSFTINQLLDPNFNTELATSAFASSIKQYGSVANNPNLVNYGWLQRRDDGKLASYKGTGLTPGDTGLMVSPIPNFNPSVIPAGVAGAQPSGFISTPKIGAKVFVFFLAGDIQKPVYFAGLLEKEAYQKSQSVASPGLYPNYSPENISEGGGIYANGGHLRFNNIYSLEKQNDLFTNVNNVSIGSEDGSSHTVGPFSNSISSAGHTQSVWGDLNQESMGYTTQVTNLDMHTTASGGSVIVGYNGTEQEVNERINAQKKINDTLKEIQNEKVKEIESNSKNGEKVDCPLCSTSHAVDRASGFAKRLMTFLFRQHPPYMSYMVDVLQFLTTVLVIPFCSIVPGSALGKCGNPECENGKIPSPQKPIEEANKKAAEKLVSKQKEINELEKKLGSGGCYSVVALKDVVISAGGPINDANCYAKTTNKPIPIALQTQDNEGDTQTPRHKCAGDCKNTPYTAPLEYPGGNIMLRGGNAVKIMAGSPGIELNTKGKISLNCGSIEILSSDGEIILGSKNHTTLSGKVVTISANDRSRKGGVQIDAPHMICQGFSATGNAAIKGGLRLDGELSVPYLNTVSQRMQCDNADTPTQRGGFSNWAVGPAQQNDIANKIRTAITHYIMPGALLMISNIIKFIMQIFNTILVNTIIEPITTGFGIGYGYVQIWNWHHNSMREPDPHHHDYILPKGTYYNDIAGVNQSAVEPSDVPSRARKNGMGPEGGPKSLAGCGGFGGWGGGSGGRRLKYNRSNSFGLDPNLKGFTGTPLNSNNTTYKYRPDGTIDLTINDTPC
jgi:hypothetical protein